MKDWAKAYTNGAVDLKDNRRPRPPNRVIVPIGVAGDLKDSLTPRTLTFTRKHSQQKNLVRYVLGGEGGTTGTKTINAFVYSPSNRLRVGVYIAIEPDNQSAPDASFNAQPTWTITAMARNPENGRETALQQAYPSSGSKNVPDGYEADTALQLMRVNLTIADNAFASAYVPDTQRANVQLIVTWEPNVEIPDEELRKIYSECSIQSGPPILLTNNAV